MSLLCQAELNGTVWWKRCFSDLAKTVRKEQPFLIVCTIRYLPLNTYRCHDYSNFIHFDLLKSTTYFIILLFLFYIEYFLAVLHGRMVFHHVTVWLLNINLKAVTHEERCFMPKAGFILCQTDI